MLQTPHGAEAHKFLTYYHILRGDWATAGRVLVEYFKEFERGCRIDVGASQRLWKVATEGCQKLRVFNPAVADYWLGRALVGLKDKLGAIQAYESALSQQLLYPARGEVEKSLQRLKGKGRKVYRS